MIHREAACFVTCGTTSCTIRGLDDLNTPDTQSPVMEMREDGSHRIYVYGDGRLLASADYSSAKADPSLSYYLHDHLGSTIAVLDEEGHTVWPAPGSNPDGYQKYQPHGEFASDAGDTGTQIPSFTGTTKGPMQFTSPDPVYGNLSDPMSWNRYAYCQNNPVNYIDPTGKWTGFVHGTWSNPKTFGSGFISNVMTALNDSNMSFLKWSDFADNNNSSARSEAAERLLELILNVPSGEPINLVGHSHGGNVILEMTHLLAEHNKQTGQNIQINNIIMLNTPIVDYNPNYVPDMSVVGAVNVFSVAFDPVQVNGGSNWSADLATYAFLLANPKKGGERGSAKRTLDIPGVNNVVFGETLLTKYGLSPMSLVRAHSFLKEEPDSNNSFWQNEIDRRLYLILPGTN